MWGLNYRRMFRNNYYRYVNTLCASKLTFSLFYSNSLYLRNYALCGLGMFPFSPLFFYHTLVIYLSLSTLLFIKRNWGLKQVNEVI